MAHGDDAALAGYPTVPATAEVRAGHDHHNETRDLLAQHTTDGTHPWTKITGKPPLEGDIAALQDALEALELRVADLEGA